jgi:hypothetical protein
MMEGWMQLDNTLIAVRSRTNSDLLDLAVVLCRQYLPRYLLLAFIGWLPWVLMDIAILWPIIGLRIELSDSIHLYTQEQLYVRFTYLQMLLFAIQLPAATLPLTYWLGQQMFHQRPTWRDIIENYFANLWMKFIALGIVRGIIPMTGAIALLVYSQDAPAVVEYFLLPIVFGGLFWLVRAMRPFVAEVAVLEQYSSKSVARNQNSPASDKRIKFGKRMKSLHELVQSEMVIRFIYIVMVSALLLAIVVCAEMWVVQFFYPRNDWTWWHSCILMPINLILLSVFTTVFRFVSYINTRILLEGWEVRLRLMSEAERLKLE